MFSNTGSTIKHAIVFECLLNTRSSASILLNGTTYDSPGTDAFPITEFGESAGPALSSDGLVETITASPLPWYPPSTFTIPSLPV